MRLTEGGIQRCWLGLAMEDREGTRQVKRRLSQAGSTFRIKAGFAEHTGSSQGMLASEVAGLAALDFFGSQWRRRCFT